MTTTDDDGRWEDDGGQARHSRPLSAIVAEQARLRAERASDTIGVQHNPQPKEHE